MKRVWPPHRSIQKKTHPQISEVEESGHRYSAFLVFALSTQNHVHGHGMGMNGFLFTNIFNYIFSHGQFQSIYMYDAFKIFVKNIFLSW